MEALPPELAGRYRLLERLGAGAYGTVDAVQDLELDRQLALKRLRAEEVSPESRQRFLRECRCLATLDHPNVVRIHDAGLQPEGPWILMERLRGTPLDEAGEIDDGLQVCLEVADALGALHSLGLVHRDVKPANLFRTEEGRLVLLDLGLARPLDRDTLTGTGLLVGTPAYMSPEAFQGSPASPASDWYSLGVVLFEILEGQLPFTPYQLLALSSGTGLPTPRFQKTPPGSPERRVTRALMASRPSDRPHSRRALEELIHHQDPAPTPTPRPEPGSTPDSRRRRERPRTGALATGILGLALLAGGIGWASRSPPPEAVRQPVEEPASALAPPPELLRRAEFFQPFRREYWERSRQEKYLLRTLAAFRDPALGQRWRGYLHSLGSWLESSSREGPEAREVDRTLLAPENLPHFRALLLEIPQGFLDASQEVAMRLLDPSFYPETPELQEAMAPLYADRDRYLSLRNEIHDLMGTWLSELPPRIATSDGLQMMRWVSLDRRMGAGAIRSEEHLMEVLLPRATRHPAAADLIHLAADVLTTPWAIRLRSCEATLGRLELFLEQARQIPLPNPVRILRTDRFAFLFRHLRGECSPPLSGPDRVRLLRAREELDRLSNLAGRPPR